MTKLSKRILFVLCAILLLVADLFVVSKLARKNFNKDVDERMNLHSRLRTLEFDASMNEQLTLVRQMVKSPSIVKFLVNPKDEEVKPAAWSDFLAFQDSFLSKSLYWTSDSDLEFWSGMKFSYCLRLVS